MTTTYAVVVVDDREREICLEVTADEVTLAEVVTEVVGRPVHAVVVDGRPLSGTMRFGEAGIRNGSALRPVGRSGCDGMTSSAAPSAPSIAWHRPPRPPRATLPGRPVGAPPPPMPDEPDRPGLALLLVPVVIGIGTALLWNPMFAVFALAGPMMTGLAWRDGRRKYRRRVRHRAGGLLLGGLRHRVRFRLWRASLRIERLLANPTAADLIHWPAQGTGRLWERRPGHDDFMTVSLGTDSEGHRVLISLACGGVVGVIGDTTGDAVVRAVVVQIAAHHGPADCRVECAADDPEWAWASWLPHSSSSSPRTIVIGDVRNSGPDARNSGQVEDTLHLVTAPNRSELPAHVNVVVDASLPLGSIVFQDGGRAIGDVVLEQVAVGDAVSFARAMARYHDPEAVGPDGDLPTSVRLLELAEMSAEPEEIALRWKQAADDSSWATPIGVGAGGVVDVDLVEDGPHALVAGTTGSGKSELLRTWVVGLAASHSPQRLNFVLIDYKGGDAFDGCAVLPHVAGLVTDLDEGLAARALVCLEAELRRREELLRAGEEPVRLVIVVDEFAALAAELPDFMGRLVDIAQRGRSLGVHLVLATQRPAGIVSDAMRANINMRVALRVQSIGDSVDLIGNDAAATITSRMPGRAMLRRGSDHPALFQTASVSGVDVPAPRFRWWPLRGEPPTVAPLPGAVRDLDRIVDACRTAASVADMKPPRRPWPDPLPGTVDIERLPEVDGAVVFGFSDDPHRQTVGAATWRQEDGHLLLFGVPGSGTTSTIATIAVQLAKLESPPDVYVIDCDDQRLAGLVALANVGAVVGADEAERQLRLLRMVADHIAASRGGADRRRTVLLVDGFEALLAGHAHDPDGEVDHLVRSIVTDGGAAGIALVASAKQPAGVPHRIAALCPDRLAFRLVDRFDYIALGCDRELRSPVPGRALRSSDGLEIQVAKPPSDFPPTARDHRPPPVQRLPTRIDQASIGAASHVDGAWSVPVGLCDRSRLPGTIALGAGRHGLVAGPARSGRSSVLRLVARLVTQAGGRVGVIADPRSAVSMVEGADVLEGEVGDAHLAHLDVVVVDDADGIDAGWLLDAIADRGLACGVLAAGETMALVRGYGHWTERIRRERSGLLLAPEPSDGDLLRVRLRRTQLGRPVPGRGVLVGPDGIDVIQTALPAD